MRSIDVNADMGESFGVYRYGADEEMMPYISSANVACGFHAGDPVTMHSTVRLAKTHGVRVGAHVSVPDLMGFGRRYMKLSEREARDYTLYQLGALSAVLRAEGLAMSHMKLHGALYMMALDDIGLARAIADAVALFDPGLAVYTLLGSDMDRAARERGLPVVGEFFADRPYYRESGVKMFGWRPEEIGDAETIARRVRDLVRTGVVEGAEGTAFPFSARTVCVHSDTPDAAAIVKAIHQQLTGADIRVGFGDDEDAK